MSEAHKSLKGTKTEKNLEEAFAGESMARNKYTYFASKAKKEGFVQIAALFEETAANEREHAKIWYKYLPRIWPTPPQARTSNGPTCTPAWPKKPAKKVSPK